jgi:hypothetical protein
MNAGDYDDVDAASFLDRVAKAWGRLETAQSGLLVVTGCQQVGAEAPEVTRPGGIDTAWVVLQRGTKRVAASTVRWRW